MTDEERQRYEYERAYRAGRLNGAREMRERAAGACDVARRSHASARAAVVLVAQAQGWSIAEVLAPGAETRAAEVAHLEARRGALLAEVDRLAARDRDAGVVIEDLRKMLAAANADHAAARLDGAREMREQPAAWGAMPTAAEVAARCEGREEPDRGAPWMRRHTDTSRDFVEVVYLRAIDGLLYHREPDGSVWYLMREVHEASRWRPIDDDGMAAQEVPRG